MTLWTGCGGSYIERDSFCFFPHQPCAKLRGLYSKLGEDFASSPPFASSSQLRKHVAGKVQSEYSIEERRKDTVCQGKEKTKETDLLSWLFHHVC